MLFRSQYILPSGPARHTAGAGLTRTLGTAKTVHTSVRVCAPLRAHPLKTTAVQSVTSNCALRKVFCLCKQSVPFSDPAPPRTTRRSPGVLERASPRINSFDANAHDPCFQLGPLRPETPIQEDKLLPRQARYPHDVVGYLPVATPAALPVANTAVPNPSFKPSPNGVPRGPGWRYAVHFRHPGPRVTPLGPA